MANGNRNFASRQLETLFNQGTVVGLNDAQLLERFASRRDEAAELAFEALVHRHGPMVFRVCRGILRDSHDAHDAFQATFLVLVKRPGACGCAILWVPGSIRSRTARRAARGRLWCGDGGTSD